MPLRHPGARFGLRHTDPLPVQVEPVVIGARKLPVHVVLGMLWISIRHFAAIGVEPGGTLRVTVGIKNCGHQDNTVGQLIFYSCALRRSEVINDRKRCIHTAGFRAVHTIVKPGNDRHVIRNILINTGLCQRIVLCFYFIEPRMIRGRCGDNKQDRPALVRETCNFEFEAVRHICDRRNVIYQFMVPDRSGAKWPAQESLRSRDGSIVGHACGKHLRIGVTNRIGSQYAAGQY